MNAADGSSTEKLAPMPSRTLDVTLQNGQSKMTAAIVPFPIVRRHKFILRQASRALELNVRARERHIQLQLNIQGETMRRKGIEEDLIDRELRFMGSAIRALVTCAMSGGAQ
jgi:hypothetical protein